MRGISNAFLRNPISPLLILTTQNQFLILAILAWITIYHLVCLNVSLLRISYRLSLRCIMASVIWPLALASQIYRNRSNIGRTCVLYNQHSVDKCQATDLEVC